MLIDCPARHWRAKEYPFGDMVPSTVRMLRTVTEDRSPVQSFAIAFSESAPLVRVAIIDQVFPVWTNSYGAVAAILHDGRMLGLRPGEFEIESWNHPIV